MGSEPGEGPFRHLSTPMGWQPWRSALRHDHDQANETIAAHGGAGRYGGPVNDPRVLVIGLDPYRVPGPWDPAPVAELIAVGMARFAEAGVGAESCLFGLDGSDDIEAVVTEALDRRPWEVVVIGGGVRRSELFERVLNLVHRRAPGAAIAFNETPDDTYAAAARWLA